MGVPQIKSIDKYLTYPLIKKYLLNNFVNIHPINITLYCIIVKILSLYILDNKNVILLGILLLIERILDCLDGEVARKYNKCSELGHYMDKYSDVLFRIGMIYYGIVYLLNLISWNIYAYILWLNIIILPSCYLYDYINGYLKNNLICNTKGIAIIVEDNATLLCFLLPYLLYKSKI